MPKKLHKSFYPTEQVNDLLQQTKTLQGFWGGKNGNASESEVINYILVDYLTNRSNIQHCANCDAWIGLESQYRPAGVEVIKCPSCGHENETDYS